jgi:hypothetical protein
MNGDDQFEKRLRRQPLRNAPSAWREEILAEARKAETPRHASRLTFQSQLSTLSQQLATLLPPHPRAWAGLAAVWLVIIVVNISSREGATTMAEKRAGPPTQQMREMLREQQQMLAELFDQPAVTDRTKASVPRPQSFYRNEFWNA